MWWSTTCIQRIALWIQQRPSTICDFNFSWFCTSGCCKTYGLTTSICSRPICMWICMNMPCAFVPTSYVFLLSYVKRDIMDETSQEYHISTDAFRLPCLTSQLPFCQIDYLSTVSRTLDFYGFVGPKDLLIFLDCIHLLQNCAGTWMIFHSLGRRHCSVLWCLCIIEESLSLRAAA